MEIFIKNAFANNLKNINVNLPIGKLIGVAGVSGSGKSTLVKEIISAYGAQCYSLSLPMFERSIVADKSVIPVDSIDNLPATLMIDVVNSVNNPNSTLSTITNIHYLLRKLYYNYGIYRCPVCNSEIEKDIYSVLSQVPHAVFAEVKCDSLYKDKVSAIKNSFIINKIEYYNCNDEPQSKKVKDGYVRIFLKVDSSKTKNAALTLKKVANLSLRCYLYDTKKIADTRINTICHHCHAVLPKKSMGLFSFNVSHNDGGGACEKCAGSGRVLDCNVDALIKKGIPMNNGGISTISEKGIQYTTVTEKFLDAIADKYHFSWDNSFDELTMEQKIILLEGAREEVSFTDRRGANGGKKTERFHGIKKYTIDSYRAGKGTNKLIDYVSEKVCPECKGNRLDKITNQITYRDVTLNHLLTMSINDLGEIIDDFLAKASGIEKDILYKIRKRVSVFEDVGCGYLELNRQSTTLSGGELQRLRLCSFFSSNITNACILLDEPTTGLHQKDIERLSSLLHKLKTKGHTVIMVEHNRQILSTCDFILELGPGGGADGGLVKSCGLLKDISGCENFEVLSKPDTNKYKNKDKLIQNRFIQIDDFSSLYIKHQSVSFPTNRLITICGVSGSGKSTFINFCLIPYITQNLMTLGINKVENLGQKNATRTSTSNVGSLLGINDKIAQLFAKASGFNKRNFMLNANEGKCTECNGKGRIMLEDQSEDVCPYCEGKIFSEIVLKEKVQGKNILEFLQSTISQLIPLVKQEKTIYKIFSLCEQIGVGYLSLSRISKSLSKGEIQRIKLVKVLSNAERDNVYILDEPTKGLHIHDINKLLKIIFEITNSGNTVIAVEHNVDFISNSDYAIEFGPSSGKNGGKVVFFGDIKELKQADTPTGLALNKQQQNNSIKENCIKSDNQKEYIKLFGDKIIQYKHVNYSDISTGDLFKLFAYTNSEYLNAAIPASSFLFTGNNEGDSNLTDFMLPIVRTVGISNISFGRKARIVDAIGLYSEISRHFISISKRDNFGDRFKPEVFSPGSYIGKCHVCKGTGELEQIDYKLLFSDGLISKSVETLLKKRTNYVIAKKYLKKDYKLDIFRPLSELTNEERLLLLFGDKTKRFWDKGKEYYWEGLNRLVIKELRYFDDKAIAEMIHSSKCVSPCIACNGELINKNYSDLDNSSIKYSDFVTSSFKDLVKRLDNDERITKAFNILISLDLGEYNCFTRLSKLNKEEQGLIQLASYLIHPIYNSIVVINYEIIKTHSSVKSLLEEATKYCTIIISDRKEV